MPKPLIIVVLWLCMVGTAYTQKSLTDLEGLKALEFLIGDWTIYVDSRLSKEGPWESSKARSSIKKAVGDTILEEEVIGTRQGRQWIAHCWIAVDNRTSLYQWAFVDSDHGVVELYEGDMSSDGLILEKQIILPHSKVLRRIKYAELSPDSFTVHSLRSADNGNTWDLTGRSRYERVKK